MYLSDRDLDTLLPQLAITSEPGAEHFDPGQQLQPCSIDFRLSSLFWEPVKRFPLDLRRSRLLEVEPRRYYRKRHLTVGQSVILKPGHLLLARTLERFSMPNGYAGELTGRSSFARLGIMVNATGGFINPGWHGHMPLQLVNFGPNAVRLFAGLPVCQLRVVKLTSLVERPYGHESLQSKYADDDGGPSYWWRDKRIVALQQMLGRTQVEQTIQADIFEVVGSQEPEVIERLERRLDKMPTAHFQNADSLLDAFAMAEDRRRAFRRFGINIARGLFTIPSATLLWSLNWYLGDKPFTDWHFAAWAIAASFLLVSLHAFRTEVGDHLGVSELRRLRAAREATRTR